jgi:serine/threonine protein phosphatase 1
MSRPNRFEVLSGAQRIWMVSSIHGDLSRLVAIHDVINDAFRAGDRLVYLGNYMGVGPQVADVMDEMVGFRRHIMGRFTLFPHDIAYLRGAQEEMLERTLQLHFAKSPPAVLAWMLDHGLESTLEAYGSSAREASKFARMSVSEIANFTVGLRSAIRALPGHYSLIMSMKRAAYDSEQNFLFTHAGVDPALPLERQSDSFWWGHPSFLRLAEPFDGFKRVYAGWHPNHLGISELDHATFVDAGCGFGGPLLTCCIDMQGDIVEAFEA